MKEMSNNTEKIVYILDRSPSDGAVLDDIIKNIKQNSAMLVMLGITVGIIAAIVKKQENKIDELEEEEVEELKKEKGE